MANNTDTFDKADWYYDGDTIDENAASRHIYFVLEWLRNKGLLMPEGEQWLKEERPDLDVGLYRDGVTEEAAEFLNQQYKRWYNERAIINFQIDVELEFQGSEGLDEYWEEFKSNRGS